MKGGGVNLCVKGGGLSEHAVKGLSADTVTELTRRGLAMSNVM